MQKVQVSTAENFVTQNLNLHPITYTSIREAPVVSLHPTPAQTVFPGQSVLWQCRVMAGIPNPDITWTRTDGRPMPTNAEILQGGVLR